MPTPEEIAAKAAETKNQPISKGQYALPQLPKDDIVKADDVAKKNGTEEAEDDFSLSAAIKKDAPEGEVTEEGKEKGKEKKVESKFNKEKFKDFGDFEDEDKIVETWKKDREELSKAKLLAQGRKSLDENKEYQANNHWLKTKDEDLVKAAFVNDFMENRGYSKEEAEKKAQDKINKNKESNPDWLEDTAYGIRGNLRAANAELESKFVKEYEDASKSVSFTKPTDEIQKATKETLSKTEKFLGMTISKNESERMKLLEGADMSHTELEKLLLNPETRAKVQLFLKYEKQWEKNVESRTNGKAKILEKLPKTLATAQGIKRFTTKTDTSKRPALSPTSFRPAPVAK